MADTVSNDTLNLSSVSLTTGGNNSSTAFGGVITGSGSLTKTGSGTMTLTNNETYTGNTTVSAGELALADGANSDNIAGSPTITVAASRVARCQRPASHHACPGERPDPARRRQRHRRLRGRAPPAPPSRRASPAPHPPAS